MGIMISFPSPSSTRASRAWMESSARISFDALSRRRDSMYRPVMWSAMIIAPTAPNDTTGKPAKAKAAVAHAATEPETTSTSMLAWKWESAIHAPLIESRPAQKMASAPPKNSSG